MIYEPNLENDKFFIEFDDLDKVIAQTGKIIAYKVSKGIDSVIFKTIISNDVEQKNYNSFLEGLKGAMYDIKSLSSIPNLKALERHPEEQGKDISTRQNHENMNTVNYLQVKWNIVKK